MSDEKKDDILGYTAQPAATEAEQLASEINDAVAEMRTPPNVPEGAELHDASYIEKIEIFFGGTIIRIENPRWIFDCGSTQRVVDSMGRVHVMPNIGWHGCFVSYLPRDPENPVQQ